MDCCYPFVLSNTCCKTGLFSYRQGILRGLLLLAVLFFLLDAPLQAQRKKRKSKMVEYGIASFYSNQFNGKNTASGEIFSNKKMTAAHNALPLGTYVKVTNVHNKRWVVVKINDRLHHRNKRVIDLTQAAARKLGFHKKGVIRVKVEVIPPELVERFHLDRPSSLH